MESDDVVYADGGASRRARMGLCDQLVQDGYCRLGGVLERAAVRVAICSIVCAP